MNLKIFNNDIGIDFDSILAFYITPESAFKADVIPGHPSIFNIPRLFYRNLIILLGNKYNEPQQLTFGYSEYTSQVIYTKDSVKTEKTPETFGIGKEIHDELLKHFKNEL